MKAWKQYACLTVVLSISFSANAATNLKVYAASSMTNAINEIAQNFEEKYDVSITPVYGGSSSIARQIINGAPADVFILRTRNGWIIWSIKTSFIMTMSQI